MPLPKKCKCHHCRKLFRSDPRNAKKQKYCSLPECRKASKAASQKKWLAKPENRDYFRGPDNTKRVQEWRRRNPGYWRKRQTKEEPLQDDIVVTGRHLQQLGQDILTHPFCCKGGLINDNQQTAPLSTHDPPGSRTVQLGGSPPCP